MVKAVILDLDGTLVRVGIDWEGLRSRVKYLLGLGDDVQLKPLATEVFRRYSGSSRFRDVIELIEGEELRSVE